MRPLTAIAAGHNNSAELTLIQDLVTFEGERFAPPQIYGTFDPGAFKIRGDGLISLSGYPSVEFLFSMILPLQINYLRVVYCNGGYSGKVTLKTRTDDPLVLGTYNAIMGLRKLKDARNNYGIFEDWVASFTRLVAI